MSAGLPPDYTALFEELAKDEFYGRVSFKMVKGQPVMFVMRESHKSVGSAIERLRRRNVSRPSMRTSPGGNHDHAQVAQGSNGRR